MFGGKGRGVFRDFRMSRVCANATDSIVEATADVKQYQFRMNALEGNLPGVKKASW